MAAAFSAILATCLAAAFFVIGPSPVAADAATASQTIWGSTKPAHTTSRKASIVLGTTFRVSVAGTVTAVRYYKSSKNTGPHVGYLWDGSGKLLASVKFTSETTGWVEAALAKPVAVLPGATYVVGYKAPHGRYSYTYNVFSAGKTKTSGDLTALGGSYSKTGGFPASSYGNSAYFVDVRFVRSTTAPTTPAPTTPAPTATAPTTPAPTTPAPTTTTPAPTTTAPTTPAPTATAGGVNCNVKPSLCGYPDASNTGPTGTLTKVPGQATSGTGWTWDRNIGAVRTTASGAQMKNLDIAGQVVIDHPNALLSNSRVSLCGGADDNDVVAIRYRSSDSSYRGSNATVSHNELIGTPSGCTHRARSGVRDIYGEAPNAVVTGNDIYGTGNGITIEYNGTITDNWIHDLGHLSGDHHSGISTHGGALQVTIRHNTALLANTPTSGGGGLSAALTIYADFGYAQNTTLDDNLISGGAYTIFAGNSGDSYDASHPATGIKVLRNRIVCGAWVYGAIAFYKAGTGNELSGNYCDQTLKAVGA